MFSSLVFFALVACTIGGSVPESAEYVNRISGGINTTIKRHPYQVSVRYEDEHNCGGSILERRKILTAAHCCDEPKNEFSIQYGVTNISSEQNVIAVAKVIPHPNYNSSTLDNDVCILILNNEIVFSDSTKPIELATEEPKAGAKAVATGWGLLGFNTAHPLILQELEVEIIGRNVCSSVHGKTAFTKSMLCAGFMEGGKDVCMGDSGGPLVSDGKQVGVVSFGPLICAEEGYPAVYANVATLLKWIKSQ